MLTTRVGSCLRKTAYQPSLSSYSTPTPLLNVLWLARNPRPPAAFTDKPPVDITVERKAGVCHVTSDPHSWNEKGGFFISTCGLGALQKRLSVTWYPHTTRLAASARSGESYNYSSRTWWPRGTVRPFHSLSFVITDAQRPGEESALKTSHSSTCSRRENSHKVSSASFPF